MRKLLTILLIFAISGINTMIFAVENSTNLPDVSANDMARAYFKRASAKFLKLDVNGAIADFDEAIKLSPNNKELYLNRGYLKHLISDYNGAMNDYNKAISIDSKYAYAFNNRGVLKVSLKDINGAMEDYATALNINNKYADVYYNRANLRYMLDDNEGALADYDKAIEYNPKDSEAYNNRGVVKKRMNYNVGALSDYSQAIALNPKDSIAYANRGRLKKLYFDNEGAAIDLDQAVALAETQVFIKNVKPLISKQHYIAAIPDVAPLITAVNDLKPVDKDETLKITEVNTKMSNLVSQENSVNDKKESPAVIQKFDNLKKLPQKNSKVVSISENTNKKQNDSAPILSAGVASVKMATPPDIRTEQVRKTPTTNVKLAESYYIRGLQKCVLRDLRGAVSDLDKAIANNDKYADAYFYRAVIRKELGDTEGFKKDYATAIQMNPKLQQFNESNGLALVRG